MSLLEIKLNISFSEESQKVLSSLIDAVNLAASSAPSAASASAPATKAKADAKPKKAKATPAPAAAEDDGFGDDGLGEENPDPEDDFGDDGLGGDAPAEDDDFGDAPAEPEEKTASEEDVRTALKAYAKLTSQGDAIRILKKFGCESLPKLPKEKYLEVYEFTQAQIMKKKKK